MVEKLKAKLGEYQVELDRACRYYGAESKQAEIWLGLVVNVRKKLYAFTDEPI